MSVSLLRFKDGSQRATTLTWGNFCNRFSLHPLSKELTTRDKITAVVLVVLLNLATLFFSHLLCI